LIILCRDVFLLETAEDLIVELLALFFGSAWRINSFMKCWFPIFIRPLAKYKLVLLMVRPFKAESTNLNFGTDDALVFALVENSSFAAGALKLPVIYLFVYLL